MTKKAAAVAFTKSGKERTNELKEIFASISRASEDEWEFRSIFKPKDLKEWCSEAFEENDAVIFVGALGIAVRTIAPFLENKTIDPAVIVIDDMGKNVISTLSGHIGGANELTLKIAEGMGANPVITTSSDIHGRLSVDSWAVKNGLVITDMECAKKVAMEIVEGRKVGLFCDCEIKGPIPPELVLLEDSSDFIKDMKWCIIISDRKVSSLKDSLRKYKILWLIPRKNVLGIGCRKGKAANEISKAVFDTLSIAGIDIRSIERIASIDIKSGEPGILDLSDFAGIPTVFYPAEELEKVPGDFDKSDFVLGVTGVDNVCERAAVRAVMEEEPEASREENIIVSKKKCDGVTVAIAGKKGSIAFE